MLALQTQLASIVSMAGPGMSIYEILILQDQTEPAAKGAPENTLPYLKAFSEEFYNTVLEQASEEARLKALQALYANMQGTEKEVVNQWVERSATLDPEFAAQEVFKMQLQENPLTYWAEVKNTCFGLERRNGFSGACKRKCQRYLCGDWRRQMRLINTHFPGT